MSRLITGDRRNLPAVALGLDVPPDAPRVDYLVSDVGADGFKLSTASPGERWWYWDTKTWREIDDAELAKVQPRIVCSSLSGSGQLDPALTLAIGDQRGMESAIRQHRRFRGARGRR